MPGPKKKPTKLKLVEGNPGKKKLPKNEVDPPTGIPPCPRQLNAAAQREWKRVSKILHRNGLIAQLDLANLTGYCASFAQYIYWMGKLSKKPELAIQKIPRAKGKFYEQLSPAFTIMQKSAKDMKAFASLFGMSPSDRVGLIGSLDVDNRSLSEKIEARRKTKK